jgi:hypothetical protein
MNINGRSILLWAPRALAILFVLFISMFALDVFGEGYSFWQTLVALFMHLIPSFLILIALAIAWRWAWVGGILFIGLGGYYVVMARGKMPLATLFIIAGPAVLTGCLFLASWFTRLKTSTES